jgi:Ca2+-binding EF-hand superfamily protein
MTVDFSDQQLQEIRDAFALFDKDGDGGISRAELAVVMSNFGQTLNDAAVNSLFSDSDMNDDGRLALDEFTEILCNLDASRPEHVAVHQAFQIFSSIRGGGRRTKR